MENQPPPLTGLIVVLLLAIIVWLIFRLRKKSNALKANTAPDEKGVNLVSEGAKQKFVVLPKNQLWAMAIISLAIGYALHAGGVGKPPAVAFGGAVGQSIGVIAIACLASMVPASIYWLFKRNRMPGLTPLIWVVWAIIYGFMAITILGAVKGG